MQKLFVYSPLHPRASHPEKEKNNYFQFFLRIGQTQNVAFGSRFLGVNQECIFATRLGCKTLGVARICEKAEESNKFDDDYYKRD